ncbi:F-box/kelch-repeat protein At3g06240-like [Corylus avellana]|uniref:F-box/kelch-repeat protein At3g06240-like n=1 Tax=Corylus avellana TaxID=13451 RepID=UPI00286AD9C1|nr:F-box/kelch-repeat protein At3g06240-like [Corylus avellana]
MSSRELPEDLLTEILSKLPVKSLGRFKCVSKSWCSLITYPNFITKHVTWANSHNPHRRAILRHWDEWGNPRVSTLSNGTLELSGDVDLLQLFQHQVGEVQVFGAYNGIICLGTTLRKDVEMFARRYEYLSADSWRAIDSPPNRSYSIQSPRFPSYLNGAFHWWAFDRGTISQPFLLSFDMSNEVFQKVLLPQIELSLFEGELDIAVVNDSVALILRCEGELDYSFDIWLREDGSVVLSDPNVGDLELYDPRTQEVRDLRINDAGSCSQLVSYTESIVFLNGSRDVLEHQDKSKAKMSSRRRGRKGRRGRKKKSANTRNRDLPEDVIIEILSKLQVKCLLRFKCVCKSWYALITNPHFITKHFTWATSHHPHAVLKRRYEMGFSWLSNEILDQYDETVELFGDIDLSQLFQDDVYKLLVSGPCNGIFCFAATLLEDTELTLSDDYDQIVLWNPATRESKTLPQIQPPPDVTDPVYDFGLGFDPKTNDYKVVRILTFNSQCEVAVYSLRADSWRVIDSSPNPSYEIHSPRYPSYLNGVHHWWAHEKGNMNHQILLSFDMGNEMFQEVPSPPIEAYGLGDVSVLTNHVAVVLQCGSGLEEWYEIWVLFETWIKLSTIGLLPPHTWDLVELRTDGMVVLGTKGTENGALILYDPRRRKLWDTKIYGASSCTLLLSYKESLVLLNGWGNLIEQQHNS